MSVRRTATAGLATILLAGGPGVVSAQAAGPIVHGEFVSKTETGVSRAGSQTLAFTGYNDWLVALVGTGLAGMGVVLRRRSA